MKEVLMVAEKPNLAMTLACLLSRNKVKRMRFDDRINRALPLYEWEGQWPNSVDIVRFKMTSTYGHINETKFDPEFNDWRKDPINLFTCGTAKHERDPAAKVAEQLASAGRGVDHLVLWLDCDKEGENICFEVIDIVVPVMKPYARRNVHRARFSALTESDVHEAFLCMKSPNQNEAWAVDARMELDLRIGCAFTRLQTLYLVRKYTKETLKTNTVPFGPCQTPTLGFCVERHKKIVHFTGEPYWRIEAKVDIPGAGPSPLVWKKGRSFDRFEAEAALKKLQTRHTLQVTDVHAEEKRKLRPPALNTVQLLRMASSYLKISPSETMEIAERLYMDGFISYPRTETTQYPRNFSRMNTLMSVGDNPGLKDIADDLIYETPDSRRFGTDVGDHPPIVPLKPATSRLMQQQRNYDVYQMICKYFLASVASDCIYLEKTAIFDVDGDRFQIEGIEVRKPGFTVIQTHQRIRDKLIPHINVGSSVLIKTCVMQEEITTAPEHLTESDLIDLMEQHGIGTDASIPVHIQNIFRRNFVQLNADRRIIPTPMGIALIQGYNAIDDDLAKPQIRSTLEKDLVLIAEGKVKKEAIVEHILGIYKAKYQHLAQNINLMEREIAGVLHLIQQTTENSALPPIQTNGYNNGRSSRGTTRGRGSSSARRGGFKRPRDTGGPPPKRGRRTESVNANDLQGNANAVPVAPRVFSPVRSSSEESFTERLLSMAFSGLSPVKPFLGANPAVRPAFPPAAHPLPPRVQPARAACSPKNVRLPSQPARPPVIRAPIQDAPQRFGIAGSTGISGHSNPLPRMSTPAAYATPSLSGSSFRETQGGSSFFVRHTDTASRPNIILPQAININPNPVPLHALPRHTFPPNPSNLLQPYSGNHLSIKREPIDDTPLSRDVFIWQPKIEIRDYTSDLFMDHIQQKIAQTNATLPLSVPLPSGRIVTNMAEASTGFSTTKEVLVQQTSTTLQSSVRTTVEVKTENLRPVAAVEGKRQPVAKAAGNSLANYKRNGEVWDADLRVHKPCYISLAETKIPVQRPNKKDAMKEAAEKALTMLGIE